MSPVLKVGTEQEECGGILQKGAQPGNVRAMDGTQPFPSQFLSDNIPLRSYTLYLMLNSLKQSQHQWIHLSYVDSHQHSSQTIILTQI